MSMTIGRLAASAGVNVETVRYYQRRGLLHEPQKPDRGVRSYGPQHLERLDFIRRAQTMGFTLEEVRQLDALNRTGSCGETRDLAATKLEVVRARIAELTRLEAELSSMVERCDSTAASEPCPALVYFARRDSDAV
jgi:MerR family mercuric resistance operon transcriptional regulator